MIKLVCQECKKTYVVLKSRTRVYHYDTKNWTPRKYCSIRCTTIALRRFWNTPEERIRRSLRQAKDKNSNWRGGKCNENKRKRATQDYKRFIQDIYKRDNYTCKACGQVGGKLCGHHLEPVCINPDKLMLPTNVVTLCYSCHTTTDSFLVVPKLR